MTSEEPHGSRQASTSGVTDRSAGLIVTIVLALLLAATRGASAQETPGAPADDRSLVMLLDRAWSEARAAHVVPGATVAIVRNGRVAALRGFGFVRLEDSLPVNPDRSVYRLASIAKLFVAAIVMQRVDSGRLALDRPIAELVPQLPLPAGPGTITLRHLLTHTAGFDERVIGYAAPSRDAMRPLGVYLADRLPDRGWPPGAVVAYSNHGMALAAHVAEAEAGIGFDSLAQRELFVPLGMSRTWYIAPGNTALEANIAPGYRCGATGCDRVPVLWSHAYPVGLAWSTAADMTRFMIAMLGAPGALMQRQFTHDPWLPGIGFAFLEHDVRGHRVVSHAGGVPGAATVLALVPDQQLGVFIATNAGEPGFTAMMVRTLFDALLDDRRQAAPSSTGPVEEYAGAYRLARISHRTVERFPGVFAFTLRAWARGDTLLINAGSSPRRFVRTDSLRLQEVGGDARAVFRRDASGHVTHLFTGIPTGGSEIPGALERVPWHEVPYFLNEYVSWLVAGPLVVWSLWGLVALARRLWRRRRGRPIRRAERHEHLAIVLGLTYTVLATWFMFGFVASSGRELSAGTGLAFGMTTGKLALLRLAWLIAFAAAPIAWYAVSAWRRRWWSYFGRLSYSTLALGAALTAHFLVWWNYLPGRW